MNTDDAKAAGIALAKAKNSLRKTRASGKPHDFSKLELNVQNLTRKHTNEIAKLHRGFRIIKGNILEISEDAKCRAYIENDKCFLSANSVAFEIFYTKDLTQALEYFKTNFELEVPQTMIDTIVDYLNKGITHV